MTGYHTIGALAIIVLNEGLFNTFLFEWKKTQTVKINKKCLPVFIHLKLANYERSQRYIKTGEV